MSKILVSCDEYAYYYNGNYYVRNSGYTFIQRYLNVFESIRFAVRVKNVDAANLGKYNILIDDDRIEIYPIPFFRGPLQYASNYFRIRKAIKNVVDGCDVAILRLPSTVGFQVWNQIHKKKMKYALELIFDPYDAFESENSILNKIIWHNIYVKQRKIAKKADGISCVTEKYLQQRYFSLKKDAFYSYYSSINLTADFYFSAREFPQKDMYTIAHVSSPIALDNRKGYVEIIKALSILKNKGLPVKIKFAGGGDQKAIDYYKTFAKNLGLSDRIEFVGLLSQDELRSFLIDADLLALPTKAEGLPRVIIEAMAVGLPCVSTNVSGNPELLQEEFLLDYSDVDGFANKITELLTDEEKYKATSIHNFQKSKQYENTILQERRNEFYTHLKN